MAEQNRKQKDKASRVVKWLRNRFESLKSDQHSTLGISHQHQQDRSIFRFRRTPKSLTSSTSSVIPLVPSTPLINSPAAPTAEPSLIRAGPGIEAAASSKGSSPWDLGLIIAQKKISEYGLPPLPNTSGQLASEIIKSTVDSLQATINGAIQSQNSKKAAASGRLREIIQTFDRYAKVIDVAVQHHPEITALVWAVVRTTLQISLNHIETTDSLEAAIAIIAEKIAVCEFFASVYAEIRTLEDNLQQTLDLALPKFYASILVFSAKVHQYFDPATSKMIKVKYALKPFTIEFQPFINEILESEKQVRDCADVATMETIRRNSRKLSQIYNHLTDVQSKLIPLTKLNDIMNFITENTKMTNEILDRQKEMHLSATRAESKRVQELLQILTSLQSLKRHQDVRSSRIDGTGTWLLRDERFRLWRDCGAKNGTLCCYGHPGAGKTVINSIVFDHLSQLHPRDNLNVGVAVIYCDYRDQTSQTLVNILGSLLQQFLDTVSHVPKEVMEKLESIEKQRKRVEVGDISEMLKLTLARFHHTFICIDALDELESHTRIELLTSIQDELSAARIFLTGRPIVQHDVNSCLKTQQQDPINITPDLDDIRAYLNHEVEKDRKINPDTMNDKFKEDILITITTRSKGMFLLPVLHIRTVLANETIAKRRKALEILPSSLDNTYSDMVNRILGLPKPKDLGKRTLLLLHLGYRPLKLEELRHALAVELGDNELDYENIPSLKTILDSCLGLVILDEETMTVRFVHYTLGEHFKTYGSTYFPDRCSIVAEICLTYLNYGKISCHCPKPGDLQRQETQFTFLEYAACHWGHYALKQSSESVTQLALKLLRHEKESPPSSFQMLYYAIRKDYWRDHRSRPHTLQVTGVHVAAYFGLEKYIAILETNIQHWDQSDEDGRTPLSWAAKKGHEAFLSLLLGRGDVDADSTDRKGRSPLSWAAGKGHEVVVKLLLERDDVDADSKDRNGRSPLSWAAGEGHKAVVKLLLERSDVDANSKDRNGRLPLSWAARNGNGAVVRLLLERADVDANSKETEYGRSPLTCAAAMGYEAVVELLLEREDVDPNSQDNYGMSPLSFAARNGNEAIVKLLLRRDDVEPDSKDYGGMSPLSLAAARGREAVVELLLQRDDVDPDSNNYRGRSPLSYAADQGHEAVVELLLERDDVDPDSKDNDGMSPLSYAADQGHEAVVELLLERDDVDPGSTDIDGRSPLSFAAESGNEAVVELLLKRDDVDPDPKDDDGRSPLSFAAESGNEAVVELLLGRVDVDADSKDRNGRSPLSWAADKEREVDVELALERLRDCADRDSENMIYRRPPLAADKVLEPVVKLFLERDDVDPDSKDNDGRSPLSFAAGKGQEAIVRLLLERADVDTNSKDTIYRRSPLLWAAERGHGAVVKLLLGRVDVDADSKDRNGRSPLSWAALKGHEAVVKLLLGRDDVDADSMDRNGWSPLSWAADQGHEAVVRLLLERDDVDAHPKDSNGPPLSLATRRGHKAVVQLLRQHIAISL